MRYLLDTQIFIWFLEDISCLSERVIKQIENPLNTRYISIASLWEMTIKMNIEKLIIKYDVEQLFEMIEIHGFELLPILKDHLLVYRNLPLIHRDPFDRLLISVAMSENLIFITSDDIMSKYDVLTFI